MYFSTLPVFQNNHGSALKRQAAASRVLSTGKRINQFADDAAGAAVSTMMNMRASGLEVAQRNVGEALSMATMTDLASNTSTESSIPSQRTSSSGMQWHLYGRRPKSDANGA